jgi:hypothetical protein
MQGDGGRETRPHTRVPCADGGTGGAVEGHTRNEPPGGKSGGLTPTMRTGRGPSQTGAGAAPGPPTRGHTWAEVVASPGSDPRATQQRHGTTRQVPSAPSMHSGGRKAAAGGEIGAARSRNAPSSVGPYPLALPGAAQDHGGGARQRSGGRAGQNAPPVLSPSLATLPTAAAGRQVVNRPGAHEVSTGPSIAPAPRRRRATAAAMRQAPSMEAAPMSPDIAQIAELLGFATYVQAECSASCAKLDRFLADWLPRPAARASSVGAGCGLAGYTAAQPEGASRVEEPAPEVRPVFASAQLAAALASAVHVKAAAAASLKAADQLRTQAAAAWATAVGAPPRKSRWDSAEPRTMVTLAAQGIADRATALADPTVIIAGTRTAGPLRPLAAPLGHTTVGGVAPPLLPVGSACARLGGRRGRLAPATAGVVGVSGLEIGPGAASDGSIGRRDRPQGAPVAYSGSAISRPAGSGSGGAGGSAALVAVTRASTTGGAVSERGRWQAGRARRGIPDSRRVPGGSPPGASGVLSPTAGANQGDRCLTPAAPASSASTAGGVSVLKNCNDAGAGGDETAPAVPSESRPGHPNLSPSGEGRSTGSGDVPVGTASAAANGVSGLTSPVVGSGCAGVGGRVGGGCGRGRWGDSAGGCRLLRCGRSRRRGSRAARRWLG